jgi:hypothetical protein
MAARMAGHTGNNTKRQGVWHAIDQETRRGVQLNVLDGPRGVLKRQFPGLYTRSVDAGYAASLSAGRVGLATSAPPQLGQTPCNTFSAHKAQNVHSNEQIRASTESGARARSQHSQDGRSCSMKSSG